MTIDILLLHSPLVGPSCLMPLGDELGARSHHIVLPDLREAMHAARPQWRRFVELAVAAGPANVVVGFSGAGVMLPLIATVLQPAVTVFLDAVVPGDEPEYSASKPFVEFIDTLPHDGDRLPPWSQWWGPDVMAEMVPDELLRQRITADVPRVTRSFYDDVVPLPPDWPTRPGNAYLQLSAAYGDDRAQAVAFGWPTAHLDGRHLDVAAKPVDVADCLVDLIERVRAA